MINLVFADANGRQVGVEYDIHPRSQEARVPIPEGAATVAVYLGTTGPGEWPKIVRVVQDE